MRSLSTVRKLMFAITPALALGGIAYFSAEDERQAKSAGTRNEAGAAETTRRPGAVGAQGANQG